MSKSTRKKRAEARSRRKSSRTIIGVVIAIIVIGVVLAIAFRPTGYAEQISVAEAADKRAQGVFVLDVRTVEEWEDYHIPDSTLIPLDQLATRVNEVPRDQEIVVVCRTGNRSQQGRDILEKAGFTEVTSMTGGLKEWAAQGYPTVTGP